MALSDPQSIKINGVTTSLPRVDTGNHSSEYASEDGLITYKLSTVENRRKRQVIRVDVEKVTSDPFIPAQNTTVSMSFYMVFDRPAAGYTNTEALNIAKGLIEAASATEYAILKKLLGGES